MTNLRKALEELERGHLSVRIDLSSDIDGSVEWTLLYRTDPVSPWVTEAMDRCSRPIGEPHDEPWIELALEQVVRRWLLSIGWQLELPFE